MKKLYKGLAFAALALSALAIAGCATQRCRPGQSVFVYVAPNKAITYQGDTFGEPSKLPQELIRNGVTPQNQIIIVPQGEVEKEYLIGLVEHCGRGGLPNAAIREPSRATSFAQKRGKGLDLESSKPPRVNFSGKPAKKR